MSKIILIIVLFFLFSQSYGQQAYGIVYLKNGDVIKGNILQNNPNGIKVGTCCGSIFSYSLEEIDRIEKDTQKQQLNNHNGDRALADTIARIKSTSLKRINMVWFSSGILLGNFWNAKQAIQSTLIEYNYRFNRYMAAGIMVGYEALNESTIPVAINLKAIYPLKNYDFFVGFSGGHNFSVEIPDPYLYEHHSGGELYSIEAGIRLRLSQNNSFFIAAGYRYNELHYKVINWWIQDVRRTIYFNRFSLRIGIVIL